MDDLELNALKSALGWCNPGWGLAFEDYVAQVNGVVSSNHVDADAFISGLESAMSDPFFEWIKLVESSGAVSREDYPEILESEEEAREFALTYLLPVLERQKRRRGGGTPV